MDYQLKTHCPNCFKPCNNEVCTMCGFDRSIYFKHHAAAHHLPLFTQLGDNYVLGRVLGESNFAIVYAAVRLKDQINCAIKEFFPRDLAQRHLDQVMVKPRHTQGQLILWQNRFLQEAELLRSCYDHPSVESGIVHYTDTINQHNSSYLVMERVSGTKLSDYLSQQKQLSAAKIWIWLKPLLETLQRLHAKEIYHRELSLNNIVLTENNKPILMDFGLGCTGAKDDRLKFSTLHSCPYLAPEQLSGEYCDQRTDLYAIGAIIYCCLHGESPPSIEARQQGAVLKTFSSSDKAAQILHTAAVRCLEMNLNLRPKDIPHLLSELTSSTTPQTIPQTAVKTGANSDNAPVRSNSRPTVKNIQPPPQVLTKPRSFFRTLIIFLIVISAFVSLGYGALVAFQKYDEQDSAQRKQDNLLFSQAKSIADYKKYLTSCITCENQERAIDRLAVLQHEEQVRLIKEEQQRQEELLFKKAQSVDDFKIYLKNCSLCSDKVKAEERLAQLNAEIKAVDDKLLAEQEKVFIEVLKNKDSGLDFYQQNCPPNIPVWQRAAGQGSAIAQLFLGGCYHSGNGIKQNFSEAMKWYSKAANQENAYAQYSLAEMYQQGYGTGQAAKEAAKWYRKAAEQGLANAQYVLGQMYENEQGVRQDYKQAVDWYLRAAEQGHAAAQYSLAGLYHYGSGVEQDYQEALKWYRKSAEQNNDKAQYLMGIMYEQGYGVRENNQTALMWYQKAAKQGNVDAIAQMKSLDAFSALPDLPEDLNIEPEPSALTSPPSLPELF